MSRGARWLTGVVAALAACTAGPAASPSLSPSPPTTPSPSRRPVEPVVVAVKGDWGAGTPAQLAVTARMCAVRKRTPFRFVLTTGDNFYTPDGRSVDRTYDRPERCLLDHPGHAWRATWGNHDVAGNDTARVLGADARYYRWSAGGADLFALDSNVVGPGKQLRWLRESLQESRARVKIVYFHHSPYTVSAVHRDDVRVKGVWVPLFERFGVTLVLTGHSHQYEHHVVDGLDYVVTGGGGAPTYACARDVASLRACRPEHHFLVLEISPDRVGVRAIAANGDTIDRFVVTA